MSATRGAWECRHGVDGRDWCDECHSAGTCDRGSRCQRGQCVECCGCESCIGARAALSSVSAPDKDTER